MALKKFALCSCLRIIDVSYPTLSYVLMCEESLLSRSCQWRACQWFLSIWIRHIFVVSMPVFLLETFRGLSELPMLFNPFIRRSIMVL